MKTSAMYPSPFVSAKDLPDRPVDVTIAGFAMEEVNEENGTKVSKPVIWFHGASKKMILNKTNVLLLESIHGDDSDLWIGKTVVLVREKVMAFGENVDCIRIRRPNQAPPQTQAPTNQPAQPAPQQQSSADNPSPLTDGDWVADDAGHDDIPF